MNKALRIVLPLLVLLLGIGAKNWLVATGPQTPSQAPKTWIPVVETLEAQAATRTLDVHSFGEVVARNSIQLVAQVAAQVVAISDHLYPGASFAEGEVLLRLDDTDYRQTVSVREAQLQQAQAQLHLVQADAQVAMEEWERLGKGEASALVKKEPQLASAQAAVDLAQANLELARTQLQRTLVRAPFAGRCQQRQVEIGSWVGPGSALAKLYATEIAEVRVPLSLTQLTQLGLALTGPTKPIPALLSTQAGDQSWTWQGQVVRTEATTDAGTRMVDAIIEVKHAFVKHDQIPPLSPGMFVQVQLRGRTVEQAFLVPSQAVLHGNRLRWVDANNHAHEQGLKVLATTPTQTVFEGDFADPLRIILTPLPLFVEDMEVQPLPPATSGQQEN